MLPPISLDDLEPVGDEAPRDCVIVELDGDSTELVSFDGNGKERERVPVSRRAIMPSLIAQMWERLAS